MQRSTQTKTLKSPVYKALSRFFLLFALFYIRKDIPCGYVRAFPSHTLPFPLPEVCRSPVRSGLPSVKYRVVFSPGAKISTLPPMGAT